MVKTVPVRINLREMLKARGVRFIALAGHLNMHRSNLSAIASGGRGVSLEVLQKMAHFLNCAMGELLVRQTPDVFKERHRMNCIDEIESKNYDGLDKSWVDRVTLAHRVHYQNAKRKKI